MDRRSGGGSVAAARVLALPAARLGAAIATGVALVAIVAGAVRTLPLLLAPGVPIALGVVLARGVVAVALEIGLFVAPPIAWALVAARAVDRGELRALAAIGVSPSRLIAGTWPALLAVALATGLASAAWGAEASRPGALVRDLLAAGRATCARSAAAETRAPASRGGPAVVEVPLVGVAWVCFPGEPPRVVAIGDPRGRGPLLTAAGLDVSDDLRAIHADDLVLMLPGASPEPSSPTAGFAASGVRFVAGAASIHGIAPIGRASNLAAASRALLLGVGAGAMALAAGALVLSSGLRSRVRAFALGAIGPAAALLTFSQLERGAPPVAAYGLVPVAGLLAIAVAAMILARSAR